MPPNYRCEGGREHNRLRELARGEKVMRVTNADYLGEFHTLKIVRVHSVLSLEADRVHALT